jgi:hypothetical protein
MCTGNKTKESASGECKGRCASLSGAPEAEVLKQKQECHGTQEISSETVAGE